MTAPIELLQHIELVPALSPQNTAIPFRCPSPIVFEIAPKATNTSNSVRT